MVTDMTPVGNGGVSLLYLTSAGDQTDGGVARDAAGTDQTPISSSIKPAQKSALKSSSFTTNTLTSPLLPGSPSPVSGQFVEQRSPPRREHQECCALM